MLTSAQWPPKFQPVCSIIEHAWGNCHHRISNIITNYHFLSPDHKYLKVNLKLKLNTPNQRFRKIRKWSNITKNSQQMAIHLSPELNYLFQLTDPEIVALILQNELNAIINVSVPPKIKQVTKNSQSYLTAELGVNQKEISDQLTLPIQSIGQ